MALKTNIDIRKMMVYQVFPRQYSKKHNFKAVTNDLDRIKNLGTDILYLLPIHPIGKLARKGTVGSPYAIYDYYKIHKDYGTLKDLEELINEAHKRDIKVMMDIVFNHMSKDSILTQSNPEWFLQNPDGTFRNRIGDWSDVADFDFNKKEVWEYLIDVLKYWAKYFDGFRCDVAPLLPLEFWKKARKEVEKVNPNIIWLTESVHLDFIKYVRSIGFDAFSDSEMYQVFDVCYDYDIDPVYRNFIETKKGLDKWLYELDRQEAVYPKNYIKLRCLENHDQDRISDKFDDVSSIIHITAFNFFLRGMPFVYAGQERLDTNRPNLFEYDLVNWDTGYNIEHLIKRLSLIHKDDLITKGTLYFMEKDKAILKYELGKELMIGYFNILGEDIEVNSYLKNGTYKNLVTNKDIVVEGGKIKLIDPVIIKTNLKNKL